MRQQQDDNFSEQIRDRLANNDPIVDPMIAERWADLDLPFRGEIREQAMLRVAEQLAQRRTIEGISTRVANQITSPFINAIQEQAEDTVRRTIMNNVQNVAERKNDR